MNHITLSVCVICVISFVKADPSIFYPDICGPTTDDGFPKPGLKMPKIGDAFRTKIQCNLAGDNDNRSLELTEVFQTSQYGKDRKKSSVTYRDGKAISQVITDYTFVERLTILKDDNICLAAPLSASDGQWIFTGKDNGTHAFTASAFLKMISNLTDEVYLGKGIVRNINVDAWSMCYQWPQIKATFNITFFWSDPDLWTPAIKTGKEVKSIPVTIKLEGKGNFKDGKKHIIHEYDFMDYIEDQPDNSEFDIPPNIYCDNMVRPIQNFTLPKTFSFSSEVVSTIFEESVISYQKHYFDSDLNITRMDFKPFNDEYSSQVLSETGVVVKVHDFMSGIAAEYDTYLGNCTLKPIPLDAGDAVDVNNNKVRLADAFTLIGINKTVQFRYYRMTKHREIEALVYVGLQQVKGSEGIVHELWFALSTDETEGTSKWVKNQPLRYVQYARKDPLGIGRIDMNIFHFDDDRPDISLYDISICVDDNHKHTYSFELDGNVKYLMTNNRTALERLTLLSLTIYSGLSFLQITGIQFDNRGTYSQVIFTLLDLTVKGDSVNSKTLKSVADGIESIKQAINQEKFFIVDPDMSLSNADLYFKARVGTFSNKVKKGTFYSGEFHDGFYINTAGLGSGEYSSGSLAMISIFMLLIGLMVGVGIIYILKTKNKLKLEPSEPSGFAHAEFKNEPETS